MSLEETLYAHYYFMNSANKIIISSYGAERLLNSKSVDGPINTINVQCHSDILC